MTSLLALVVVAALAAYRLTLLVTTDTLSDRPRRWLVRRFPPRVVPEYNAIGQPIEGASRLKARWPVELVNCNWCMTVWSAGAVVLVAHTVGMVNRWGAAGVAWVAAAGLAGLLADLGERLSR